MKHSARRGVSIVELLVVIGILSVLAAMTFQTFNKLNSSKALSGDAFRVLLELQEARSLTVASKNADTYGVHFATTSVTLFEGTTFVAGSASNVITTLNHTVIVSTTTIAGGGADVVFARLTGETAQNGTVKLSLAATPSASTTITIYKTGIAEIK